MSLLRALAVAAVTLASTARAVAAQHDLVTLPLADPAYRQLEGLARQGCQLARVSPHRPYFVGHVREAIAGFLADPRCRGAIAETLLARFTPASTGEAAGDDQPRFRLGGSAELRATFLRNGEFRPLWAEARSTDEGDPQVVGIGRGRVTWNADPRLVAVVEGYAQTDSRNDPRNRALPFRETEGVLDFSEAYLNGRLGPLILSVGRSSAAWLGRGEESLALSAHGPALDRVSAVARWSHWEARALFASLDKVSLDPAVDGPVVEVPETVHRLLAAHVLSYTPASWVELTLGETVLIGRRGPTLDLAYANPLMLYLITEHDQDRQNEGDQNNIVVFGGLRVSGPAGAVEAELHVDDIQIDAEDRERIPDQLGLRIAGTAAVPLPIPASVGVEYRRLDSFTYLRRSYNTVYQRYGSPIGSELGPDADMLRVDAEGWMSGVLRLNAGVARWRRGARRLNDRPSERAEGHAGEPFPSVTVERPEVQSAWLLDLSLSHLGIRLPVEARVEVAKLDNVNNRPDAPATYARVSLVGTYRFRYP